MELLHDSFPENHSDLSWVPDGRGRMYIKQDATDQQWPEVYWINGYARDMRVMYLGVKGLGILVITWTTVVLLGGFVSMLQEKDFWSLTAITLIQLAGTFDYFLVDKLDQAMLFPFRAFANLRRILCGSSTQMLLEPGLCSIGLMLAYSVIIFFLTGLFALGLFISTGISLWRLVIHDYGKPDGGANLKPALDVLYWLALVQGMLFLFMNSYALVTSKVYVERVRKKYNFPQTNLLVPGYLEATVAGCKKARGFTNGRNLVTYAVDLLMESKSPESYIKVIRDIREMLEASLGTSREVMSKQLLTDSASFNHIVRKLLRIIHPTSRYNRETREHAAGIVMFVADEVRLDQFPGGIQSISSLLHPSEEYPLLPLKYHWDCFIGLAEVSDQGDWLLEIQQQYELEKEAKLSMPQEEPGPFSELLSVYTKMSRDGLSILWSLADYEGNCRVISNTEGLMSRITAPLISSQLHQAHHEEWTNIAEESLPLICKFMAAPGDSGVKLRRQVSSNDQAIIRALQSILECDTCRDKDVLRAIAMEILLDLSVDASSIVSCARRCGTIISALLRIFLLGYTKEESKLFLKLFSSIHWMKKRSYIRNLASGELVKLSSQSEITAQIILQTGGESTPVLHDVTNTLVGAKNNTYRMRAAEILEHLCRNYTNDDNYFKSLKEAVLNAVPKVLTELLGCGSTGASTKAGTEENQPGYSAADSDLEGGPALPDNEQRNIHSSHHQQNGEEHGDSKLQEALLSLCATVCQKWISTDPDLARRFDEIATKMYLEQGKPVVAFTSLVEEAGEILKKKNA